jgi:hypothetical protein
MHISHDIFNSPISFLINNIDKLMLSSIEHSFLMINLINIGKLTVKLIQNVLINHLEMSGKLFHYYYFIWR